MTRTAKTIGFIGGFVLVLLVLMILLCLATEKYTSDLSDGLTGAAGTLGLLISGVGGILQTKFLEIKNQLQALTRRLAGPRFSLSEKSKERYVRVAIAGLGGTGKTSLIRKITGCKSADPRMKTGAAKTYSTVRETAYEDRTDVCRIDLEDYRGQKASELLENIRASADVYPVTALMMMVDLFDAEDDTVAGGAASERLWDQSRVDKHIREWSDQLIGVLLDTMDNVKYISLFINKADLVNAPMSAVEKDIKKLFTPIVSSFKARGADKLIRVFVGSAMTDRMISTQVSEWMEDASVVLP